MQLAFVDFRTGQQTEGQGAGLSQLPRRVQRSFHRLPPTIADSAPPVPLRIPQRVTVAAPIDLESAPWGPRHQNIRSDHFSPPKFID
jgi:hypothetical protein